MALFAPPAETGKRDVVRALLRLDAVDPDSKDLEGNSPFYYAVVSGNDATAKILADSGRVDRNVEGKAKKDRTAYGKKRPQFFMEEV
ncbi:hypothetical protein FGADI_574 [Fusarium gaditjirri]|uniref:Ankyrin n=1 Tax=Fusarium gaditjirri TaxID=282569 RepID=A0A8H4TNE3_9HYPO|nr:hypothetical protein FGADI_574 [Fusarium gaditjirri]